MVQIVEQAPSALSRFLQHASPGVDSTVDRLLEQKKEDRKRKAEAEAEERKAERQRQTAKALGLPEAALEPSVMAALLKEKAKDQRNQQLLQALGIVPPQQNIADAFMDEEPMERGVSTGIGGESLNLGMGRGTSGMGGMGGGELGENQGIKDISDEQIALMALTNPTLANIFQKRSEEKRASQERKTKEERRQFEADRTYHTGLTAKTREKVAGLRESLPRKRNSLALARDAIETGNVKYFSPDKLAEATGIDLFRTAKGAQLATAGKENLLSNMARASAKAQNQWFEQRLNSMFPKIGNSDEANLTIQAMLEGEMALDEAYLKAFDEEAAKDREQFGYEKGDIDERAHKAIEPLEKKILDRTSYQLRQLYEKELGVNKLRKMSDEKVPKGTPLTLEMAEILVERYGNKAEAAAKKLGYSLPDEEIYMEFAR